MRIDGYSFGTISIDGRTYHQDLKIVRKQVIPDWWRKTGHKVFLSDVEDILSDNPEIVVFGTGDSGNMETDPELTKQFRKQGIELIELPTARATEVFNRLNDKNRHVAAGFHLTC